MKYLRILGSKFGNPETGVQIAARRILEVRNEGINTDREKTNQLNHLVSEKNGEGFKRSGLPPLRLGKRS